jgi:hypothetical protein
MLPSNFPDILDERSMLKADGVIKRWIVGFSVIGLVQFVAPGAAHAAEDLPVVTGSGVTFDVGSDANAPEEDANLPDADSWPDEEVVEIKATVTEFRPAPDCSASITYKLENLKNPLNVDFRDSAHNGTQDMMDFTLKAEKSTAMKYTVSLKLTTTASAAIFGKIQAEVNGGVERTKTTTYGSTVTGHVRPKKTVFGDRGMYEELVGFTQKQTWPSCDVVVTKGKAKAPYREHWHLYTV